jgi:predicted DCC family thiol-disulfide oxidoreductase YuxK
MSEIVVLTDGECRFCEVTLSWMQKKLVVDATPFQKADLAKYGLNYGECSKALHVVHAGKVYVGANAIAYLLGRRGNYIQGYFIRASGPLGRFGYKWVAGHRNSWIIRFATKVIERSL